MVFDIYSNNMKMHPIQLALMAKRRHFYKLYIKETSDNQAGNQSYINLLLTAEGMVEKQWVDRHVLDNLAGFYSIKNFAQIKLMSPSAAKCLPMDCCFSELALKKIQLKSVLV
jgi:hypothetical protein